MLAFSAQNKHRVGMSEFIGLVRFELNEDIKMYTYIKRKLESFVVKAVCRDIQNHGAIWRLIESSSLSQSQDSQGQK